jgi:NAD(P)H-binding
MRRHGVRRLLVQSSYGVGATRDRLPISYKVIFALLLKPQIEDTELQELETRRSGLDWTIVQPVSLTDLPFDEPPFSSPAGETRSMRVSRDQVGCFVAGALGQREQNHQTVALSAAQR